MKQRTETRAGTGFIYPSKAGSGGVGGRTRDRDAGVLHVISLFSFLFFGGLDGKRENLGRENGWNFVEVTEFRGMREGEEFGNYHPASWTGI